MLRLSHRGLGLLNAQYRSVLKKCLYLNMLAAALFSSAPAWATGDIVNIGDGISSESEVGKALVNLKTEMGQTIGATTEGSASAIGTLYVNEGFQNARYSNGEAIAVGSDYGPWIINYNEVYIGYQYNSGTKSTLSSSITLSNMHNVNADSLAFGGSIIVNGSEDGNSTQPTMQVHNVNFTNNSASSASTSTSLTAGGGVISNYSSNSNNKVESSTFTSNYVMSSGTAEGGAIANVAMFNKTSGSMDVGYLVSSGNTYSSNYAGNTTSETTNAYMVAVAGTVAETARGGAIFNTGTLTSSGDTFSGNYAFGNNAFGGAIYNGITTNVDSGTTYTNTGSLTITNSSSGTINFSGNYVSGNTTAYGGAIANAATLTSNNSYFSGNRASGPTAGGGAVYNNGTYSSVGETYSSNSVTGTTYAQGGAVYIGSSGSFTITGAASYSSNTATATSSSIENFASGGAFGGAIYNTGTLTATSADSLSFTSNTASGKYALGGAIYNCGSISLTGAEFTNNKVDGTSYSNSYSYGGAISANGSGSITVSNSTFSDNTSTASASAYGGAISLFGLGTSSITDSSFTGNTASGSAYGSSGGAIYNQGSDNNVSVLSVIAKTTNVVFSGNQATTYGSVENAYGYGGAIANNSRGQTNVYTDGGTITFTGNSADYGGALSNAASGTTTGTITSFLRVAAENGDIIISHNSATKEGGGLFNYADEGGMYLYADEGNTLSFTSNTAENGGAISNSANSVRNPSAYGNMVIQLGNQGTIELSDNRATAAGGAIYNLGNLSIVNTSGATGYSLLFGANTAATGAAIYNSGTLSATLSDTGTLTFDGNTATGGLGGAIYNGTDGNVTISLSDNAQVILKTTSDDIYNLGTVTITGDGSTSATTTAATVSAVTPTNTSSTALIVNSTLAGTGTYNISDTRLIIGSTGYIDYEPVFNLTNNVITLSSSSYMNLDTSDTLSDNDFNISSGATLTYKATSEKPDVTLANTVTNSGLLNLSEGVISDVTVTNLVSNNGTIKIDVDNATYTADRIIVSGVISGTTNISFDNSDTLTLESEKIYFAQTQADLDLSTYSFVSKINNGLYEIGIDYDNGYASDETKNDWYFYRTQYLNPEVIAYIDLPRASIEQSRSLLVNVERISRGSCNCYRDDCNYKVCNFKDLGGKSRLWATPFYRSGSWDKPIETDFSMYGLDFGYDHQFDITSQFGIFGSYRDGTYENDGKGEGNILSRQGSELDITSIMAGIYYRKYFGDLYFSGTVYGGQQSADIKADNGVTGSTDGLNLGAQAEVGYNIRTTRRSVLTPSLKATYDYIKFDDLQDSSGKDVTFDAIHDIELELGIKYEYQFNNEHQLPTTGYIKPSVVQMIANGGEVTVKGTNFDETLENETLGRVEIGADAELVEDFSVGAFGNYTFGSGYSAWGIGGNIRYVW